MALEFRSLADFGSHGFDTLIDVRSPAEFSQDHIPGAINLPVLSNLERADVGRVYKQQSPFSARKICAALLAQNAARHLLGPLAQKDGGWRPLVCCWRGGQRSGAFAMVLQQVGWRAETVQGGYQSYRRLVSQAMHMATLPHGLLLLDGNTGTAKTELLHRLAERGEQIVDLEALAGHRGSVFGGTGQGQPTQKSFESALAAAFAGFDRNRRVWLEAESSKIGNILIPPSVWQAMKAAPRLAISAPIAARASYLVQAYGDITQDHQLLIEKLSILTPHQGHEQVAHWQSMVANGQMQMLAGELMQKHYDPAYARSRHQHGARALGQVTAAGLDDAGLSGATSALLDLANKLGKTGTPTEQD